MANDPKLVKTAISPAQMRGARGLLGWSQTQLAEAAGMSLPTVKRYETAAGANVSNDAVQKLRSALEAAGVEFTNGGQPGVRLVAYTVSSGGKDGVQGIYLARGLHGSRIWMSYKEAQEEAERMRRAGDEQLWLALRMVSPAPPTTKLPEDPGGA